MVMMFCSYIRLKEPDPPNKGGFFPRFGSKFRYSGRTQYQSKHVDINRSQPDFDRSHGKRFLSSRSMDGGLKKYIYVFFHVYKPAKL